MSFCLTLEKFELTEEVATIPVLEFDLNKPDYWLLLSTFEEIEDKTGKLIDIGEAIKFTISEMDVMLSIVKDQIEKESKEINDDALFEQDAEKKLVLLKRLAGMIEIGIDKNVSLIGIA